MTLRHYAFFGIAFLGCSSNTVINNGGGDGGPSSSSSSSSSGTGSSSSSSSSSGSSGGYGPECQRYLACCEKGASAAACEASVKAGGAPSAAESFCKSTADANGCP
jgi:hypothetical protein